MRNILKATWNRLTDLLASVGNARGDVRKQVPYALGPAVMTGSTIVLTAIIAMGTMAYAVATAFAGASYAIPAAVAAGGLWGAFVLSIDRALVASIDKSGGKWTQVGNALVRLPFAIAVGIVISKPVLLRVASPVLDHELRAVRNEEIAREHVGNATAANLPQVSARADSASQAFERQAAVLTGPPRGYEVEAARSAATAAASRWRKVE